MPSAPSARGVLDHGGAPALKDPRRWNAPAISVNSSTRTAFGYEARTGRLPQAAAGPCAFGALEPRDRMVARPSPSRRGAS